MRLGEVANHVGGITFRPEDTVGVGDPDSVVCMRTRNVQAELDTRDLIAVPQSFVRREEQFLRAGDILVSSANSWNLVGKCCYVPELGYAAALGGFISLLRPNRAVVDPRYLYRWLAWDETQSVVRALARQTTNIANLPRERFLDLDVPVLPLPEQRRIAAILDEADALRRKRREALALLDDLLRATFLDMFGDPVTNPRGWETVKLGELITDGPTNGLYRPASDYGRGTPIVRIDSFYDGQLTNVRELKRVEIDAEWVARYALEPGQMLINRVNSPEHLGKAAIVPRLDEATVFESNMMRLSLNCARVEPEFVVFQMLSPFVRRQIANRCKDAVNQSSINQDDVRSFELRVPPLADQRRWVASQHAQRNHTKHLKESLATVEQVFASLLHRAFSGGV